MIEQNRNSSPIRVQNKLGRISFDDALRIQEDAIVRYRRTGDGLPVVYSLEHDPVITCGRSTHDSNLLLSEAEYEKLGIQVRKIDRGGDVTYHGPGQVVVYPVVALRSHNLRVGEYVRLLEESMIRTCADYGIKAFRRTGFPGCWTDNGKIGAVGTAVKSGGITKHGLSFNVSTNLDHFKLIVPCGIADFPVVRLADLLETAPDVEAVAENIVSHILQKLSD